MVRIGKIWLFDPEFKNPTGFLGEFPKCIQITYSKHDCLTLILFVFSVCQILEMPKISLGVMMQPSATEPNNPCTPGVSVFLRHLRGQFGCCKKEENQV